MKTFEFMLASEDEHLSLEDQIQADSEEEAREIIESDYIDGDYYTHIYYLVPVTRAWQYD